MISAEYNMTFGYGRTDSPYGTAAYPYHKGDDWYMPDGTPIVVNGVQIGVSGHTGFVTGPHCHIGRFVNGKDTNPNSMGWALTNPRVTDIGYDSVNGNYVGLLDSSGARWVYLHMQTKSTNVKVGDYLDQLPKYNQGGDVVKPTEDQVYATFRQFAGHEPANPEEVQFYLNNDIRELYKNILYFSVQPKLDEVQQAFKDLQPDTPIDSAPYTDQSTYYQGHPAGWLYKDLAYGLKKKVDAGSSDSTDSKKLDQIKEIVNQ